MARLTSLRSEPLIQRVEKVILNSVVVRRALLLDTNFPAVGSAEAESFQCTHNDVTYDFADFHILTTDGTNACNDPSSHLPTPDNNGQGLFCAYADNTLRAIYNWDNSAKKYDLKWLKSVTQIGSRSGGDCGVAGATKRSLRESTSQRCFCV